jgi:hypothetical protein
MARPEAELQQRWINYLRGLEWFVKPTHGNMYQQGFPDLFCSHSRYGHRWCEMKVRKNLHFTPAQLENFPKLCANGSGVWIIIDDIPFPRQYELLRKAPNWWTFLDVMK